VFELVVGDGETWSEPTRSYVVVLDPGAGERYLGCGCNGGAGGRVRRGASARVVPASPPRLNYMRARQARPRREDPASRR
jgi:hypothetical protein